MTCTRKEGFTDSNTAAQEKQQTKVNITNAQHLCSGIKTIILPPKFSQNGEHDLNMRVQKISE